MSADAPPSAGNEEPVRQRLLAALEQSVIERGLLSTTIADIVARAATSRRTFYEHFESKEACYLEFLRITIERLSEQIVQAIDPAAHPAAQIRQGVRAWLTAIEENTAIHISVVRELPSLGPPGRQLRRQNYETLTGIFQALASNPQLRDMGITPVSRETALILLGGLNELITTTTEDGGDVMDVEPAIVDAIYALLVAKAALPPGAEEASRT